MAEGTRPPATYSTIARALKSARADVWTSAQLWVLDRVIDMLCDDLWDLNPRFNSERFKTMAGYAVGTVIQDQTERGQ